jgi:hypothetical protein
MGHGQGWRGFAIRAIQIPYHIANLQFTSRIFFQIISPIFAAN